MIYFTKIKDFLKKYWFIIAGAIIAYIAIIFPKKSKENSSLKQYKDYSNGQQGAVELEELKNEKINNSIKKADDKLGEIETSKQENIKNLSELEQEDLTKKLSDKFNINNLDG